MIEVYSTDTDAGLVSVARRDDSGTYQLIEQISVGNAPRGSVRFTMNGRGFVSNCGGNTISEIDVQTHREVARITVGIAPRGIGIVRGDRFALVSNSGSDSISVVDLRARKELYQLSVSRDPRHMAISSDGRTAYIALYASHHIAKLDIRCLAENRREAIADEVAELARIPVGDGSHPYSVALHEESHRLYVANTLADYVSVIDTETDTQIGKIEVGIGGRAIAFSPNRRLGLVTLENSSEMAVFDLGSQEVVRRIPVGTGPRGIAVLQEDFTVFMPSFPRGPAARADNFVFSLNSVTIVHAGDEDSLIGDQPITYSEISVGKGPCGVAVINTDEMVGVGR